MARTVNQIILVGHLGGDPEIRMLDNGTKLARMSLATGGGTYKKNGEEKTIPTEWHPIACFGALADLVEEYCHKGDKLFVSGRLTHRKWQGKDGGARSEGAIVALGVSFFSSKSEQDDDPPFDIPPED